MLQQFISDNTDAIVARTRQRVEGRVYPPVSMQELEYGVPLFLAQLAETLRDEGPLDADAIARGARHGAELLEAGFTVSQVVHDYGDICRAITEIAIDCRTPITPDEFHALNRCLDTAIAGAVTEHTRLFEQARAVLETEHLGHAVYELRNTLNTAILAFQTLKRGDVGINGSTGAVLGRSLIGMREINGSALSEIRLAAGHYRRERLLVIALLDEIAATGVLHSEYRKVEFTMGPVDPRIAVDGDPQLLASAVTNVLQNAFKFTAAGGHVSLRTYTSDQRLFIEVKDECEGFPQNEDAGIHAFGDRRGAARAGLGLSIAHTAMRAHNGEIYVRNAPGTGCIFVIEMPLADARAGEM